jgi:hypothetical protein
VVGTGALDATLVASDPEVRKLLERGLEEHARTWSGRVA